MKRWTMRNNGTTTWTAAGSYGFAFDGEEQFSAAEFTLVADGVSVAPGATYDWDVAMTAPATIVAAVPRTSARSTSRRMRPG